MNKNLSLTHLWSPAARLFTALLLGFIFCIPNMQAKDASATLKFNVSVTDKDGVTFELYYRINSNNYATEDVTPTSWSGPTNGYYTATITKSQYYNSGTMGIFGTAYYDANLKVKVKDNYYFVDGNSANRNDKTLYSGSSIKSNVTQNCDNVNVYPAETTSGTTSTSLIVTNNASGAATVTWNATGSTTNITSSNTYNKSQDWSKTTAGPVTISETEKNFDNTITVTNSQASETTTVEYTLAKSGNTLAHGELTKGSSEDITWNTGDANAADYNGATLTIVSHTVTITTENASNTVTLNFSNEDSSLCSLAWSANDSESFSQNVAVTEAQHSISKPYVITYVNGEYNSETDRHFNNVIKATLPDGYVAKWKIEKNNTILASGNIKGSGSAVNTATWNTADADYDGATFTVFDIIDNPYPVDDYDGHNLQCYIIADPNLVRVRTAKSTRTDVQDIELDPSGVTLYSADAKTSADAQYFTLYVYSKGENTIITDISYVERNGNVHTGNYIVNGESITSGNSTLWATDTQIYIKGNYSGYGYGSYEDVHGGQLVIEAIQQDHAPVMSIWTDDKSKFTLSIGGEDKTSSLANNTTVTIPQNTSSLQRKVMITPTGGNIYKVLVDGVEQGKKSLTGEGGGSESFYYDFTVPYADCSIEIFSIIPNIPQPVTLNCNHPGFIKSWKFGADSSNLDSDVDIDDDATSISKTFDLKQYIRIAGDVDNFTVNSFTINGESKSLYTWESSAPGEFGMELNDETGAGFVFNFNVTPIARDITVNYSTEGSNFNYKVTQGSGLNTSTTNNTATCKLTRADHTRVFFNADQTGTFTINEAENPVELDFTKCSDITLQPNNLHVYLNGVRIIYGAVDSDGEYDPDNSNLYWKGNLADGDNLKIVWKLNNVTVDGNGNTSYNQAAAPDHHHVTFVNDGMNIHPDIQAGDAFVVTTRNDDDLNWDANLDGYVMSNTILVIKPHTYTNDQGLLQTSKIHSVTVESAAANSVRRRAAANTGFGTFYPDEEGKVEVEITAPSRITIHGDNNTTGVEDVAIEATSATNGNVYSLSGVLLRTDGNTADLPAGIYIVDGKKVAVK